MKLFEDLVSIDVATLVPEVAIEHKRIYSYSHSPCNSIYSKVAGTGRRISYSSTYRSRRRSIRVLCVGARGHQVECADPTKGFLLICQAKLSTSESGL